MAYPVTVELEADTKIANWRPLAHWLLAVPHLVIANVLGNVGSVVALISWFAIVFTGSLPPGLASFQCMVIRYNARAVSYALWLREPYPAFEFSMASVDPGGDPVRVDVLPAYENRNRLTVGLRLFWMIPLILFGFVLSIAVSAIAFVSFFAVLFTGNYPVGMRDFMVRCGRYFTRLSAYGYLLTDEYPPLAVE
ncbi:MAG TPA: DUF4389 domain-containing protein [Acidimicrobiia bacterium]|jgi:hypothetical protein|nr:DUF4389 domain-containing protein [Acidimicrobiia bacterium]